MSERIDNFNDLIQSLYLPELLQDLDNCHIQSEHFVEYHKLLTHELPHLFDFIQQNDALIFSGTEDTLKVLIYCLAYLPHSYLIF